MSVKYKNQIMLLCVSRWDKKWKATHTHTHTLHVLDYTHSYTRKMRSNQAFHANHACTCTHCHCILYIVHTMNNHILIEYKTHTRTLYNLCMCVCAPFWAILYVRLCAHTHHVLVYMCIYLPTIPSMIFRCIVSFILFAALYINVYVCAEVNVLVLKIYEL